MAISQSTVIAADGSVDIAITVPFIASPSVVAGCLTTTPIMRNLTASQSSTGGTLAGGHNYYYQIVAIDINGLLSWASDLIEVVVPAGTNTNQITLAGPNPFDQNAAQYQVYRAQDAPLSALLISGPSTVGAIPFSFTDTGLSPSTVAPPTQNIDSIRVYWRITGTTVWTLGAQTRDNTQTSLTFTALASNISGQSLDIQLRQVDLSGKETSEVLAPTTTYVVTATYPTALLISGAPNSNPVAITTKGAIPPTLPQGIFTYTSTTTSVTISWAAFSVLRADGTTTSVGSGSLTITGLSASTTYNFYPYFDEFGLTLNFATATGGGGSPAVAFTTNSAPAAQVQNLQGFMPLSNGPITAVTPASGTGGGGTGGGGTHICVRAGMLVNTQERGVVPIETCEPGEHLSCEEGWTEVVRKRIVPMKAFVRIVTRKGFAVEVTPTHEIILAGEPAVPAARLSLNNILYVKDGLDGIELVRLIHPENSGGENEWVKVSLSCEPVHMFYAGEYGPDILVHNNFPIS